MVQVHAQLAQFHDEIGPIARGIVYTLGNEVDVKLAGNSNWRGAVCYVNFKNATYTIPAT